MSTAVNTKKSSPLTRKRIMYLVGILIQLVLPQFLPTWGGITPMGVRMLCTFIGTMVLFMGTGDLAGSCLLTGLVCMLHGYSSAAEVWTALLGNATTFQMIMMLMYSYVLNKTGVMLTLGRWIISHSRVFQKRPLLFNIIFMLVMLICNFFIGGTVMVFTLLPLFEGLAAAVGYKIDDKWHKIMVSGIFMTSICCWYSRGTDGMVMNWINIFQNALTVPYTHNTFQFMIAARAGLLIFVILYCVVAKFLFRCDMSKLAEVDMDAVPELRRENIKFTRDQIVMLCLFFLVIIRGYISAPFPAESKAAEIYGIFNLTVVCMVALVITSLITYKGKPITDLQDAFNHLPFGVCLSLGLMGIVAGSLAKEELGIRGWMLDVLSPIYGGLPYPLFVFFILLTTCFITNLMSNQATIIMMSSIAAAFLGAYSNSWNFIPLIASICMVGNIAQLTYSSGPVSAIYLDRIEFRNDRKFVYTVGVAMMILSTLCFTFTTCLFGMIY